MVGHSPDGYRAGRRPVTPISCRQVARAFGAGRHRCLALDGCTFAAQKGEIIGVIGPNGAGKTTLLKVIAGELVPTSGTVLVAGHRAATRAARRKVGYASDPPIVPVELTGIDWLKYLASHRAMTPARRIAMVRWAIEFGDLGDFAGRRIGEYSRGMSQRLALAAAAMTGELAVLLDEVLSGLDPLVSRRLRTALAGVARSGRVVVLASHDLGTVEQIATRVLVLVRGKVVADVVTASLLTERVGELSLRAGRVTDTTALLHRFPGSKRTDDGISVPLTAGLTIEQVLAAFHSARIPVAASRVRYRVLEDLLVQAVEEEAK